MIVLDTHAWIWWAADREKLPRPLIRRLLKEDLLVISAISCWEVAMLIEKGRLALRPNPRAGIRALLSIPLLRVESISEEVAIHAGLLKLSRGDPADRLIVATAELLGLPLVTKDRTLRAAPVSTVWD